MCFRHPFPYSSAAQTRERDGCAIATPHGHGMRPVASWPWLRPWSAGGTLSLWSSAHAKACHNPNPMQAWTLGMATQRAAGTARKKGCQEYAAPPRGWTKQAANSLQNTISLIWDEVPAHSIPEKTPEGSRRAGEPTHGRAKHGGDAASAMF